MTYRLCLIVFLFVFLGKANAAVDYSRLFIGQVLDLADVIVLGEIVAVQESTVVVEVDRRLKGEVMEECLIVEQFRDWTCASRWGKYEIGQKAVYCLRKLALNKFGVIGAGNEGEFPIVDSSVYFLTYISSNTYSELGHYGGYKFDFNEAIYGITEYIKGGLDFQRARPEVGLLKNIATIENKLLQKIAAWKIAANYDDLGLTFEHRVYLTREYIMK